VFFQVTVVPGATVSGFGVKQLFVATQAAFALAPAPVAISISFAVCPNAGATPKIATRAKRPNNAPNGFDFII
jgi:hypothetical protein